MPNTNNKNNNELDVLGKMMTGITSKINDAFLNDFEVYSTYEESAIMTGFDIVNKNKQFSTTLLCNNLTDIQLGHFLNRVFIKMHTENMLIQLAKDKSITINSDDMKELKMETEITIINAMKRNRRSKFSNTPMSLSEKANLVINERFNNYLINGI